MSLDELLDEPTPEVELIHFYAPVTIPRPGFANRLVLWGDEVEITPFIRAYGVDRNGDCWADLAKDPEAQLARWGKVRYASGPWPAHLPRIEPGSNEEREASREAYVDAWAITSEPERKAALAKVREEWGPPATSSATLMHFRR